MIKNNIGQESQENKDIANQVEIGKRIKEIRELSDLNQIEFAKKIGLKQSFISRVELGKVNCLADMICSMHEVYGASPNYILLGYEPKFISNDSFFKKEKALKE
ncbi:helix-turn-helix domain-containing protein, partial [Campylobacter sp. MIT 97-5078]